ncbi:MAG: adenylyltransferase/cytidyltransferase family protein [Pseudomonadota bacterium]|nr:adenylyltransferase/cytidyltransferase family protein [Pseudomonadota bacterium]
MKLVKPATLPDSRPSTTQKIVTVEALASLVQSLKASGKTVIQAHGTFDLLHLGHVKHLEAARKHADVLVVTLTADAYVNKGPNRPVFKEYLRAEMLAALEVVDYVAINYHADAVPAIRKIRPDFYAKGQDYINPEGDITGKITEERLAIEEAGGKIVFTEEMTFSSTELLNRNFNIYEPHLRTHLEGMREEGALIKLQELIESVKDMRVLVIGDAIIDEYHYVLPMGKSAKEHMIATRYQDREQFAGGVFATANHISSFCKQVEVITALGGRDDYSDFLRERLSPNVKLTAITRPDVPTTRKRRFVDPTYMRKLFEVYFMDDEPLVKEAENALNDAIARRIGEYDVVIANDFGHGLIGQSTVALLCSEARFLAVNSQSNSANMGYNLIHKYPRADYVSIDAPEARLAVTDKISPIETVISKLLPERIACSKFIITHGKHGCITHERGDIVHTIPALTKSVVDTVGAGDAFLAVTAPLVAKGAPLNQVGFVGNIAGALKVAIIGHQRSVNKIDVLKSLAALLK